MTQNQLVTVLIPVFNSENYLEDCLNSIFNQTHDNIQIIAINDGSTDSSLQILEKYTDPKMQKNMAIISQPNRGLASALNLGISHIRGNWCKWLSPDDMLYPNAIEVLLNEAKKQTDNTILYSNWDIIDDKGKLLREFHESDYNRLSDFDYNIRLLDVSKLMLTQH